MSVEHWMVKTVRRAKAQLQASKTRMRAMVAPTMLRRPDTKDMLRRYVTEGPEAMPPMGREKLAQWVVETYGEGARHILPYLGIEEENANA